MNTLLSLNRVSKTFTPRIEAIRDVSLEVKENEFICILGPTGCGKSTLLRLIAGLEQPSSGIISLNGQTIKGPGSDRGMVFQKYTSFPWLTVEENVAFGLKSQGVPHDERRGTVEHLLKEVGLWDFRHAYPSTLSGGMQQRVALARTLAVNPRVLLLDEPLGALDAQTRSEMQLLLLSIFMNSKHTILFVTHDIEEALFLGQRLIVSGPRPFEVRHDMAIPFSYPRPSDLRTSTPFANLEQQVTMLLRRLILEARTNDPSLCESSRSA